MRALILKCYIIIFSIFLIGCEKTAENYAGNYSFEIQHHSWGIIGGVHDTTYYHNGIIKEIGNKEIMIEYNSPSFYPAFCYIKVSVDENGNLGSPEYAYKNTNDHFAGKFLNENTMEFTLTPNGGNGGGGSFKVIGIRN